MEKEGENIINERTKESLIQRLKVNLSSDLISKLIGVMIVVMIGDAFVFGYLFKQPYLMKLIFIVGLFLLIFLFCLRFILYPEDFQQKNNPKRNSKEDDKKEKRTNNSPPMKSNPFFTTDYGFGNMNLPTAEEYSRNAERAFGISSNKKSKRIYL